MYFPFINPFIRYTKLQRVSAARAIGTSGYLVLESIATASRTKAPVSRMCQKAIYPAENTLPILHMPKIINIIPPIILIGSFFSITNGLL